MTEETKPKWTDCWRQQDPKCPYCGAEQSDICEVESLRYDGDATEIDCGSCEREFTIQVHVSWSYTTEPIGGWPELEPKR